MKDTIIKSEYNESEIIVKYASGRYHIIQNTRNCAINWNKTFADEDDAIEYAEIIMESFDYGFEQGCTYTENEMEDDMLLN